MGLAVLHLHLHGLYRGHDLPLGHDGDTGGQTLYVHELALTQAARPEIARVEVLTRLIEAPGLSPDYARPEERVNAGFRIRRLRFGPGARGGATIFRPTSGREAGPLALPWRLRRRRQRQPIFRQSTLADEHLR